MKKFSLKWMLFFLPLFILNGFVCSEAPGAEDTAFVQWIADFYPEAHEQGISRVTWDKAFDGVMEPDPRGS